METRILSLGTRPDATTWENGCKALGFNAPDPLRKPAPSLGELKDFFKSKPDWIFLAGHFSRLPGRSTSGSTTSVPTLFNDAYYKSRGTGEIAIEFHQDKVTIKLDGTATDLEKTAGDFNLHTNCRLVVWGGCNLFGNRDTILAMRALFGSNHVILGFYGTTGWKVVDALLGGGFIRTGHFFERVTGKVDDTVAIRDAWMLAAARGYGGGSMENIFRALDPDGQEWMLQGGRVVRGRKIR